MNAPWFEHEEEPEDLKEKYYEDEEFFDNREDDIFDVDRYLDKILEKIERSACKGSRKRYA